VDDAGRIEGAGPAQSARDFRSLLPAQCNGLACRGKPAALFRQVPRNRILGLLRGGMEYNGALTLISMGFERLDDLPDDGLVDQFKRTGDKAYFGEIFKRHRRLILQCCLAMMRDPEAAADVTQDTFLKAMEGIEGYGGGQLRAWLVTIAKHQCINQIRSKNRGPRRFEELEGPAELAGPQDNVVDRIAVRQMLAGLSREQQICLKLFYFNGMSYEQIAGLTGEPEGLVKSHIQNGRRRLRGSQADCEKK
jgi:RNA polymerase sigma-70 factor (ECF subfamily)